MYKKITGIFLTLVLAFSLAACSSDKPAPEPELDTTVFTSSGPENYMAKVTVQYQGDKVYYVTDVVEENFESQDEYYEERVEQYKQWQKNAQEKNIEGHEYQLEIGEKTLKSTVTIDMNKADVHELYPDWVFWETDKDYLSYEEVYYNFVDVSGFNVEES